VIRIPLYRGRPTYDYLVSHILARFGPLTREQILRRLHVFSGSKISFKRTSNGSYFLTTFSNHYPASQNSFIVKGLIKQVGKKRHSFVYNLTEKGEKLAGDYEAWCLGL